jgi:hypothetical protein
MPSFLLLFSSKQTILEPSANNECQQEMQWQKTKWHTIADQTRACSLGTGDLAYTPDGTEPAACIPKDSSIQVQQTILLIEIELLNIA